MRKSRKNNQTFEVAMLRSFWASYILAVIAILLSFVFITGVSKGAIIILAITAVIGVSIMIGIALVPKKFKHISKIVAVSNVFLILVRLVYALYIAQVQDLRLYHLDFLGLCLITPLLFFHLFIAFDNKVGRRLGIAFFVLTVAVASLFLLGLGSNAEDTFIQSSLITFLFICAAYLFMFSASFRLMHKENEAKTKAVLSYSYIDSVTQLANRTAFTRKLRALCKSDGKRHYGLIQIDINGFKRINDHYGQHVGDYCLKLMAQRIKNLVPSNSVVARTDGDEFSLIAPLKNLNHLTEYCKHFSEELNRSYDFKNYHLTLPVNISACQYPGDGDEPHVLLKKLDWGMNVAKKSKDDYIVYDTALGKHMSYQEAVEDELASAIENNELELHYQAIMNLKTGVVDGAEALLRWTNPKLGKVSPEDFIPIAEKSGLILSIGNWVLEEGCRQLKSWLDAGHDVSIAINISMAQFKQENFIDDIRVLLAQQQLDPKRLELEVTESLAFDDIALSRLDELQQIGCTVKLDDFGTGYSSLSILSSLPLNELKIDKSFVQELDESYNSKAWTMIRTILNLAHSFALEVVAEGVETETQLLHLQELGCEFAQGYHISKPIDADRFYQKFLINPNNASIAKSPTKTGYTPPNSDYRAH